MIRKIFVLCLLIMAIPAICMAADSARAAIDIGQVVGIADGSSGYMLEINSNTGSAHVVEHAQAIGVANFADTLIYTGACRLISVSLTGATAGDYAQIYDAVTATGTPKFDPRLAANTSSLTFNYGGAPFSTGIYVDVIDSELFVSVVYDY